MKKKSTKLVEIKQEVEQELDPVRVSVFLQEAAALGYQEVVGEIWGRKNDVLLDQSYYTPPEMSAQLAGWTGLGAQFEGSWDVPDQVRISILKRARHESVFNPLCIHAVKLYRMFSVGQGVKFNTKTEGKAQKAKKTLDGFLGNTKNRGVMGYFGQNELVDSFTVDGEIFVAAFMERGRAGEEMNVRRIDPMEVRRIVCNVEDVGEVQVYERVRTVGVTEDKRYYADWAWKVNGQTMEGRTVKVVGEDGTGSVEVKTEKALMYHVKNGLGRRGVSFLAGALPWGNAFRKFMEARVGVQRSIAQFAQQLTMKAKSSDLAAMKARLQSGVATSSDYRETNPAQTPGSWFISNDKAKLTPVIQETGAEAAKVDGNMLILMFCLSLSIFPHYMGAGEAFRLATATAMEPPMKKLFLSHQTLWEQVYTDLVELLFERANVPETQRYIRIDFPEIWQQDIPMLIEALARLFQSAPWLTEIDEVNKIILMHLGVEDPQKLWSEIQAPIMARIKEMNDSRVMGPNGGVTNASSADDKRTKQPKDKPEENGGDGR